MKHDKVLLFSVTTENGLVVETFRSGGPGGQNQNKRDTGARVRHPESGAVGESREERSQWQNKKTALKRMVADHRFQFWVTQKIRQYDGHLTAEEWVMREMESLEHFKIEVRDEEGRWVEKSWKDM